MNNLSLKQKIIGIIAVIGTILILIFQRGFSSNPTASPDSIGASLETQSPKQIQTDTPEIVSTNPSPLDEAVLWGMQPVEITFNMPLENLPELKYKLEPQSDIKVELSNDKKTVRFIPTKTLPLGQGYTLFISGAAKFEGQKTLGKDYTFHFKTIEYKGV